MGVAGSNSAQPDLRVREAGQQPIRRCQLVRIRLVGAGLDVDGHELTLVTCFDPGANVTLVNRVATPGELLLAVTRLSCCHGFPPILPRKCCAGFRDRVAAGAAISSSPRSLDLVPGRSHCYSASTEPHLAIE